MFVNSWDWILPKQNRRFYISSNLTHLDLPRGAEWMIRSAYTPSFRVQTAPFGRCGYFIILYFQIFPVLDVFRPDWKGFCISEIHTPLWFTHLRKRWLCWAGAGRMSTKTPQCKRREFFDSCAFLQGKRKVTVKVAVLQREKVSAS